MSPGNVKVWDLPLRVWHWFFGVAVLTALGTGLIEAWYSIETHQWAGISVVSLLVFRLTWGFWGSDYARWSKYWTTPAKFVLHFRGRGKPTPHTAPGIVLVVVLMLGALVQSTTGLFMTDDIFFDGPLYEYIDDDTFDWVSWLHRNNWWVVVTAIGIHLVAHLVYGLVLRDATPLSMVTGNKQVDLEAATTPWMRAVGSLAAGLATFVALASFAD